MKLIISLPDVQITTIAVHSVSMFSNSVTKKFEFRTVVVADTNYICQSMSMEVQGRIRRTYNNRKNIYTNTNPREVDYELSSKVCTLNFQ